MEDVIVCTSVAAGYDANWDAFTKSEHDWLMVEVNLLYRSEGEVSEEKGKIQLKIPFICKYCNAEMVDKATLGWHRKSGACPGYEYREFGPLKIYPARGLDRNKVARAVFNKYNLKIP
ncbi:hypothetical protein KC19_VG335600 [Ceratodon purpureus]|uniref:Uncharacterized protein n=1 Tax=Ceratodon purpureus TaxID=3225 RepID=A0A8T0HXB0_CERPU|nr:hypothetical protein KC19_VG335600 [Ceratodon purpureus]